MFGPFGLGMRPRRVQLNQRRVADMASSLKNDLFLQTLIVNAVARPERKLGFRLLSGFHDNPKNRGLENPVTPGMRA